MSDDVLTLIAEARRRQEVAESERDQWKRRLKTERARLKLVIALMRQTPIPPPDVDENGRVDWQQLERIVEEACDVFADPYAIFPPDDWDLSITHEEARLRMAYRLQDMIEAAVKKARAE